MRFRYTIIVVVLIAAIAGVVYARRGSRVDESMVFKPQDAQETPPQAKPIAFATKDEACKFLTKNSWKTRDIKSSGPFPPDQYSYSFSPSGKFESTYSSDYFSKGNGTWLIESQKDERMEIVLIPESDISSPYGSVRYASGMRKYSIIMGEGSIVLSGGNGGRHVLVAGNVISPSPDGKCGIDDATTSFYLNGKRDLSGTWTSEGPELQFGTDLLKVTETALHLDYEGDWTVLPTSESKGTIVSSGWLEYDNPWPGNPSHRDRRDGGMRYDYELSGDTLKLTLTSENFNPNNRDLFSRQKAGLRFTRK